MNVDQALIEYCRAREMLRIKLQTTKEDRSEQTDAEKTLNHLLFEQMKHGHVPCIAVESGYIHVPPDKHSSMKLTSMEDLLAVLKEVCGNLSAIPKEHIPDALVSMFKQALKHNGTTKPATRVVVSNKAPRSGFVELVQLPANLRSLAEQYVQARQELVTARRELLPLRREQKAAEHKLLPLLPQEGMIMKIKHGDKERKLKIQPSTPAPAPAAAAAAPDSAAAASPAPAAAAAAAPAAAATTAASTTAASTAAASTAAASTAAFSIAPYLALRTLVPILREAAKEASESRSLHEVTFEEAMHVCLLKKMHRVMPPPRRIKTYRVPKT